MNMIDDLIKIVGGLRKYASFWEWPNKSRKELGVVEELLGSMHQEGFTQYRNPRLVKSEWPDCTVEDEDGHSIAVEVTELVDQKAIERNQRGEVVYRCWEDDEILAEVGKRLLEKDMKSYHGGLYRKVILVIHTDELELTAPRLFPVIRGAKFPPVNNIREAYIICSYDPMVKTYPFCEIPLVIKEKQGAHSHIF